jgi:hypothetical protein
MRMFKHSLLWLVVLLFSLVGCRSFPVACGGFIGGCGGGFGTFGGGGFAGNGFGPGFGPGVNAIRPGFGPAYGAGVGANGLRPLPNQLSPNFVGGHGPGPVVQNPGGVQGPLGGAGRRPLVGQNPTGAGRRPVLAQNQLGPTGAGTGYYGLAGRPLGLQPGSNLAGPNQAIGPGGRPLNPALNPGLAQPRSVQDYLNRELIAAVREAGGRSTDGKYDPTLGQLAEGHALRMASEGQISHKGFEERANIAMNQSGFPVSEVTAVSSPQTNPRDMARDCVRNLVNSDAGHRADVLNPHSDYGIAMVVQGDVAFCEVFFRN